MLPSDPKAIVAGLSSKSLQVEGQAAVPLLMQIQSGYESKAISEQEYFFAQAELLKKISPQDSASPVQAPQGASERVQALYKQKAGLVRITEGLADAVSSGKITEAAYEKLLMTCNARLSTVQSQIDSESSGQPRVVAVQRKEVISPAIILSSSASSAAELPARAREIKRELSAAKAAASQDDAGLAEPGASEKMRDEATQFSSTLDSLYTKLSSLESQVANMQTGTAHTGNRPAKAKATSQQDHAEQDSEADRLNALSNDFEGRILELSSRLSNAEEQAAARLAEMRDLANRVGQFQQAMNAAADSARQVQELRGQVDRIERVTGLLGKTLVSSRNNFEELDEISAKQQEDRAKLTSIALRFAVLESKVNSTPLSQAPAQPQPSTSQAAAAKTSQEVTAPEAGKGQKPQSAN